MGATADGAATFSGTALSFIKEGGAVWIKEAAAGVWRRGHIVRVGKRFVDVAVSVEDAPQESCREGNEEEPRDGEADESFEGKGLNGKGVNGEGVNGGKEVRRVALELISGESGNSALLPRNPLRLDERTGNLVELMYLNEASVLEAIRCRYEDGNIYTCSGIVLASLNPYTDLPIYGTEYVWNYSAGAAGPAAMAPHLFSVAQAAYASMAREGKNQSIIISGESGAGKTISAKYIMKYFATVCASPDAASCHADGGGGGERGLGGEGRACRVEDRVLAANPILEAFGNAETIRNDNSSRFGKYTRLLFNSKRQMVGASLQTFLLERSRLLSQAEGERNFHIFHQLLSGALPEALATSLDLGYDFVITRGQSAARKEDDARALEATRLSLAVAGFSPEEQEGLFRVLAAILHLGNVTFGEDDRGASLVAGEGGKHLATASRLLSVEKEGCLEGLFVSRKLAAGRDLVSAANSAEMAAFSRDALVRFLYSACFEWIVAKLNALLLPETEEGHSMTFVGVLDIYGFERFESNSFEQLCINYANEKLQNMFVKSVFELEQAIYKEEGLEWHFVQYYDNSPCLDLIEGPGGILDLIDEQCRLPSGSDRQFVESLRERHGSEASSGFFAPSKLDGPTAFTVRHFAYSVEYDGHLFLEKNRDQISSHLGGLFEASTDAFVRALGGTAVPCVDTFETEVLRAGSKKMFKVTTGSAFRRSLNELVGVISDTTAHYIRCIKPNEERRAFAFEPSFVLQQLQACGILETVKISAAGYPGRWSFPEFDRRFSLLGDERLFEGASDAERFATLLASAGVAEDQYKVGKSRIFLRSGVWAFLEERRMQRLDWCARAISTSWRRLFALYSRRMALKSAALLTCHTRCLLARHACVAMRQERASTKIGKAVRAKAARSRLSKVMVGALHLQALTRAYAARADRLVARRDAACKLIVAIYQRRREVEDLHRCGRAVAVLNREEGDRVALSVEDDGRGTVSVVSAQQEADAESYHRVIDALEMENSRLADANEKLALLLERAGFSSSLEVVGDGPACALGVGERPHEIRLSAPLLRRPAGSGVTLSLRMMEMLKCSVSAPDRVGELLRMVETCKCDHSDGVGAVSESLDSLAIGAEDRLEDSQRLPSMVIQHWLIASIQLGVPLELLKGYCDRILERIRERCFADYTAEQRERSGAAQLLRDFKQTGIRKIARLSFWIANLANLASVVQWIIVTLHTSSLQPLLQGSGAVPNVHKLSEICLSIIRTIEEIYHHWLSRLFRLFTPVGISALIEHEGLCDGAGEDRGGARPPGGETRSPLSRLIGSLSRSFESQPTVEAGVAIEALVDAFDRLGDTLEKSHLPHEIGLQVLSSMLSNIVGRSLNQLTMRTKFATWKRAIQIQYNASQLDSYLAIGRGGSAAAYFARGLQASPLSLFNGASSAPPRARDSIRELAPLFEAVKLLQLASTPVGNDLDTLMLSCPSLNVAQIHKVLSVYLPDEYEKGPVSREVLEKLSMIAKKSASAMPDSWVEVQHHAVPLHLSLAPCEPCPLAPSLEASFSPSLWSILARLYPELAR